MTVLVPSPRDLVADADREGVIDELRGHMLAGRLTAEEFEGRVEATHSARTRGDLDAIRTDLTSELLTSIQRKAGRFPCLNARTVNEFGDARPAPRPALEARRLGTMRLLTGTQRAA